MDHRSYSAQHRTLTTMNRIYLPLALFAAAALIASCGHHTQGEAAYDAHTEDAHSHPTAEDTSVSATEALPAVTLDNGRRWKANPETTTGIANMAAILGAYDAASGDPKALKASLEQEFGLIFERCTMTGEAHEQLHNYLLPIHHQLRDFEATETQREALGEHLAAYDNYFE